MARFRVVLHQQAFQEIFSHRRCTTTKGSPGQFRGDFEDLDNARTEARKITLSAGDYVVSSEKGKVIERVTA